jgi:uncharacterized protein (TIGR03437 family)
MDSPLRQNARINARYSPEALLGSSTESTDNSFDLFAAIPAPTGGALLGGPYTTVALEFPGAATANMRVTQFSLNAMPLGVLSSFTVTGHAANLAQGGLGTRPVTGATFTMGSDGTGTFTVGSADTANLLSGTKNLYLSASGNVILGGSPGNHDIVIGVRALTGATNATWNSTLWGAGLRVDTTSVSGYSGAIAARGQGRITWTKRVRALVASSGVSDTDFSGINAYHVNPDGTGTVDLTLVGLGTGGNLVVGASINSFDPGAYEIYFGAPAPSLSGTGVFLNPLGVIDAASFAPPGNPISPGQFVALFGTGLAASNQTPKAPYPTSLNGVSVLINGKNAPLYFVSPSQINALVPFATTGATTTITVQNNGASSNTVTVAVAATAPGVYSLDQSGAGSGAILHADFSLVNDPSPAAAGETIYLTAMGTTDPTVADGTAWQRVHALRRGCARDDLHRRRSRQGHLQRPGAGIPRTVPDQRHLTGRTARQRARSARHRHGQRVPRSGGYFHQVNPNPMDEDSETELESPLIDSIERLLEPGRRFRVGRSTKAAARRNGTGSG